MPGEPLTLDFDNADLQDVIDTIGSALGLNFDVDPQLSATKVTIISHRPVPAEYAYELLESILATRQAYMHKDVDGNLVKVRPLGDGHHKNPLFKDMVTTPEGFDRWSTYIIGVKHADASEMAPFLQSLGSNEAVVSAYGPTNTLILTDAADGIRNMLEFLKEIDVPGYDEEIEIFMIEYALAETLAEQITQVLTGGEASTRGAAPASAAAAAAAMRRTPLRPSSPGGRIPGARSATIIGAQEEVLEIVADARLNSLIVKASTPMMESVRSLIERLDTPAPIEQHNMHMYKLRYANAEDVETTLQALLGTTPQKSGDGGKGGGVLSSEVQPFEKQVIISRYDATDSLLIIASPMDYKRLEQVIAQIDLPQRQLHVEAVIMEVAITDDFRLSVESAGLTANDYFALNNVVNLANVLTNGPLASIDDESLLMAGVIDGTMDIELSDGAGGFITQEVPKVPVLLTAIETLTSLDVLSQPMLTMVDNEEAYITVGEEIPFIKGSSYGLQQGVSNSSVYSQIDRKDVGIKMTVTPQISEGDQVLLNLTVEVSQTTESSIGLDPNLVGPTLRKTETETQVVVRDGATGIIGGLLQDRMRRRRGQTPIMGDLPLLGWLFRNKSDSRSKSNLVILVTPTILKDSLHVERKTAEQIDRAQKANADVFFEQGFIRKVRTKRNTRKYSRPGQERLEKMQQLANPGT
jgi:general secretion pathway protein D